MGKYMRKGKVSGEVAVVEVAAAPLGVRTRARALAMQRLQKQQQPQGEGEGKGGAGGDYLELRSRRLEKLPPPPPAAKRCGGRKAASAAAATAREEEAEVFFGENVLELEAMDSFLMACEVDIQKKEKMVYFAGPRSTRETTPCSLIRDSETISTPGSTTRPSNSNSQRTVQAPVSHNILRSAQMDEFFAAEERRRQQAFMEKYNFDPVKDCPLPGRYEWEKLD